MNKRPLIRGERHHWWPCSLSQYWTDEEGLIHRIDTDGSISRSTPRKTGRISDGHNIRFDSSTWDHTFEQDFDRPDSKFPDVVRWLTSITRNHPAAEESRNLSLHHHHPCKDSDLEQLCECLVSLAVRSPKFREGIVRLTEFVRSSVAKEEHKRIVAANLYQTYRLITHNTLGHGKFVVFVSESKEFIFGDGFYHNLSSNSQHMFNCRILAPLTPKLAVLYVLPMEYNPEPRLVTRRVDSDTVATINETVQIYSKECLFYRFEQPMLNDYFLAREHQVYVDGDPVDELMVAIPGVRSYDYMLRF